MVQNAKRWKHGLFAGSLLSLVFLGSAIAQQALLTRAEVLKLRNRVDLVPNGKSPRRAKLQDPVVPKDALRTARASLAELLFNEGSIARIDQNSTFRFKPGLRRYQLKNRIAMHETVFVLGGGTALIMGPPGSVGTQVETSGSRIDLLPLQSSTVSWLPQWQTPLHAAKPFLIAMNLTGRIPISSLLAGSTNPRTNRSMSPLANSGLLTPPQQANAVMVLHSASNNSTQVFALTNSNVQVSNLGDSGQKSLLGGQTVSVVGGRVSQPQEFDLEDFYQEVQLAADLDPQSSQSSAGPKAAKATLEAVKKEVKIAVEAQEKRLRGFRNTFRDEFIGRPQTNPVLPVGVQSFDIISASDPITGVFERTGNTTATFTPTGGTPVDLSVDFDNRTITIGGRAGISNTAGLSGNNAVGTVVFSNGSVTQIKVLNVNGNEPAINQPFAGTLTTGIAPDR